MANTTTEIFGFDEIELKTPSTVSECISLVGEDRILDLAISGAMQSNTNKIKNAFVKKIEELTGEKRKVNSEGKITEGAATYIDRMKQTIPDFIAQYRSTLQEIATAHIFSLARERSAVAEVKVPQRYITAVKYMHAKVDVFGEPKVPNLEKNILKFHPNFDFSSLLDGEELTEEGAKEAAQLLRAPLEAKEKQQMAEKTNL